MRRVRTIRLVLTEILSAMAVVVPAGSAAHGAVTCDEGDGGKVSVSGLVRGMGCICDSFVLLGRRLLRAFCFFASPARNPRLADCNNLVGDYGTLSLECLDHHLFARDSPELGNCTHNDRRRSPLDGGTATSRWRQRVCAVDRLHPFRPRRRQPHDASAAHRPTRVQSRQRHNSRGSCHCRQPSDPCLRTRSFWCTKAGDRKL